MTEEKMEFQLMLVNEVRKRPALWDSRLSIFSSSPLRAKQWQNVARALCVTPEEATEAWFKAKTIYERNRTQDSSFLTGKPSRCLAKRWLFMDSMAFLDPVITLPADISPTSVYSPTDRCDLTLEKSAEEYRPSLPSNSSSVSLDSPFNGSERMLEYVPKSPESNFTNNDVEHLSSLVTNLQDVSHLMKDILFKLQSAGDSSNIYATHIATELKLITDPGTLALAKYKIANVLYEAKISNLSSRLSVDTSPF